MDYSIGDRSAADRILPLAQDKGIAVLNNVPFGGRGRSFFPRVAGKAVPDFAKEFDATTWAQFFLKYNLSHPAITAAIPGTTTVAYLEDNQAGGRGRLPDAAHAQADGRVLGRAGLASRPTRRDQSIRTKVTFRCTRYSVILPPLPHSTCISLTQAPCTFLSVLLARATPASHGVLESSSCCWT